MSRTKLATIKELASVTDIDDQAAESFVGGQGFTVGFTSALSGRKLGTIYEPGRERTVYGGGVGILNITNNAGHRARFMLRGTNHINGGLPVNLGRNFNFELNPGQTREILLPESTRDVHIVQRDPEHFNTEEHRAILNQHVCRDNGACPRG